MAANVVYHFELNIQEENKTFAIVTLCLLIHI